MQPENRRVWLITGASSGLGLALLRCVLARGDYAIAAVRVPSKINSAIEGSDTSRLHVLELDVTEEFPRMREKIRGAVEIWGAIDVLVNNAGVVVAGLTEEAGAQHMMEILNTNLFGVMNIINSVLPDMRGRKDGVVVIVGSRSAWRNEIPVSLYSASKAAVHSYGETLAAELKAFNIRVMIVEPGSFRTSGALPSTSVGQHLPGYENIRKHMDEQIGRSPVLPGQSDPVRGMKALVEVVTGEGRAQGRDIPLWLFLGEDGMSDAKKKMSRVNDSIQEWKEIGSDIGFPDEVGSSL